MQVDGMADRGPAAQVGRGLAGGADRGLAVETDRELAAMGGANPPAAGVRQTA